MAGKEDMRENKSEKIPNDVPFTVVTALYNLASREPELKRRDIQFYLEHGQHLFNLPVDIIAFCDPEIVDQILALKRPDHRKTIVISVALEHLPFYSDLNRVKELRAIGSLLNANPNKDTPLFTVLQWNKFYFLEKAVEHMRTEFPSKWHPKGPERSELWMNVVWVDFGLHYVAKDFHRLMEIRPTLNLKLLCLRPTYFEEVNDPGFLRYISGRTAAGILSLPVGRVSEYADLFRETKSKLLVKGYTPLEQEILTYIRVQNHGMFDLYYGDYENIIQNFNDECWSSAPILSLQFQSCYQYGDLGTLKLLGHQIFANRHELLKILGPETLKQKLTMYLSLIQNNTASLEEQISLEILEFLKHIPNK